MKKFLALSIVLALVLALAGCGSGSNSGGDQPADQGQSAGGETAAPKKFKIATVVKLTGINWFNRMEEGVKKFAADTGHDAFLVGPPKADAALQVQIIEDMIAQGVDALVVVPFSVEAVEPVLQRAREQGIVVITHEAANIQNADYDIEAFDNAAYGAHFMDKLAELAGEDAEYAVFVGSLTSKSHNEWADGGIARQKEKYPNMKMVTDKQESYDDVQKAYEKTKELLKAYPNLTAIQGSAASDAPGAARAVEELGLTGKVRVVGTSLVSMSAEYLESGALDMISFWDPKDAGYVANALAVKVLEGKKDEIKDGLNLGVKGYENLKLDGKVLYGEAWVDVTKENMADYNF